MACSIIGHYYFINSHEFTNLLAKKNVIMNTTVKLWYYSLNYVSQTIVKFQLLLIQLMEFHFFQILKIQIDSELDKPFE